MRDRLCKEYRALLLIITKKHGLSKMPIKSLLGIPQGLEHPRLVPNHIFVLQTSTQNVAPVLSAWVPVCLAHEYQGTIAHRLNFLVVGEIHRNQVLCQHVTLEHIQHGAAPAVRHKVVVAPHPPSVS